jgi:hypothetical protein
MKALPSAGDELTHIGFGAEWLQQLDACRAFAEKSDSNIGKVFVTLQVQAEAGLEVGAR